MKTKKIIAAIIFCSVAYLVSDQLNSVDVHSSWEKYPSADLSSQGDVEIDFPSKKDIDTYNKKDISVIKTEKLQYLEQIAAQKINKNTKTYEPYVEVGIIYAQNFFYEKSLAFFSKALQLEKKNADIYNNLANVYYLMGKNEDAIKSYKNALRFAKNNPVTLLNLAFIHYEDGSFKKARNYYLKATLIDPTLDREEYQVLASESDGTTTKAANRGVQKVGVKWSFVK